MKPNKDVAKEKQGEPSETNNETQTEADEGEPRRTNETFNGGGGDGGEPQASCGYGGSSEHVTGGS